MCSLPSSVFVSCVEKTLCFLPEKFIFKNYYVLVKIDYPPKGKFLYPFLPPILSQKLKGRRIKRKKKERKLSRKRRRISFKFFQLILSLFSIKRNSKENKSESILTPFLPHFLLLNKKKMRKNGRKETKRKEKEEKKKISLILSSCSHSP